jgi:hypothetical protein
MTPRNVGFDPKVPVHRFVPNSSQLRPVIAIVPLRSIEIAGSLSPSGRKSGVMTNDDVVAGLAARLNDVKPTARIAIAATASTHLRNDQFMEPSWKGTHFNPEKTLCNGWLRRRPNGRGCLVV